MFSRKPIQYTESTFEVTKIMIKEVKDKTVLVKNDKFQIEDTRMGGWCTRREY